MPELKTPWTRDQIRKAKIAKGGLCLATCFLSESVSYTVSCQPTPGSSLASKLQDRIATTTRGDRRVIFEEGGNPVSIGLKRKILSSSMAAALEIVNVS